MNGKLEVTNTFNLPIKVGLKKAKLIRQYIPGEYKIAQIFQVLSGGIYYYLVIGYDSLPLNTPVLSNLPVDNIQITYIQVSNSSLCNLPHFSCNQTLKMEALWTFWPSTSPLPTDSSELPADSTEAVLYTPPPSNNEKQPQQSHY
jgi:hypothetical protein